MHGCHHPPAQLLVSIHFSPGFWYLPLELGQIADINFGNLLFYNCPYVLNRPKISHFWSLEILVNSLREALLYCSQSLRAAVNSSSIILINTISTWIQTKNSRAAFSLTWSAYIIPFMDVGWGASNVYLLEVLKLGRKNVSLKKLHFHQSWQFEFPAFLTLA